MPVSRDLGMIVKYDRSAYLKVRFSKELAVIVGQVTHDVEAGAKARAPVRTGFLRNSIQSEMRTPHRGLVRVGANYGAFVEHGTRNMAPQPFLRPAFEEGRSKLIAECLALGRRKL